MPDPLVPPVQITCFLDKYHAGDQLTRRSYSGILIYINRALIIWYSKRQNTVEASLFRSEIICGSIVCEKVEALTNKLWMFGMRVEGLTNMYVYNGSVVKSSTMTESILKKRHLSILYHAVRKAVADGKVRIGWVPTGRNLADLLT